MNKNEEIVFKNFIQNGGGFVGIHSATDTEYEWEWYGKLVGAYFKNHPKIQKAKISTINKNPRSWITAIVGAEYIFNLLPKGTHEFDKFIKPSVLAKYIRDAGGELIETKGMFYNPITHKANLNNDLGVNYLMYAKKP